MDNDGMITSEIVRERRWIRSHDVSRMAKSLLENAILQGTLSWDETLKQTLYLVLQAATTARAGDILSSQFNPHAFLRWKDIRIAVSRTAGDGRLTATFTLEFCKGGK